MKCPICDGTGEVANYHKIDFDEPTEPITNEEWLRSCTTMELAEFIRKQRDDWSDGWYSDCHRFGEIVEWLKQPHHESVTVCNE